MEKRKRKRGGRVKGKKYRKHNEKSTDLPILLKHIEAQADEITPRTWRALNILLHNRRISPARLWDLTGMGITTISARLRREAKLVLVRFTGPYKNSWGFQIYEDPIAEKGSEREWKKHQQSSLSA